MNILGISAFYHDSAAALIRNGRLVAAVQEERFTRRKHDERFPERSIRFCLQKTGLQPGDLDAIVFYEKPLLKFERLLHTYLACAPRGFSSFRKAMQAWLGKKLFLKDDITREMARIAGMKVRRYRKTNPRILFTEHHESHAASAFFPSPFESAAVLTMDGVGEWATASIAHGSGNRLKILRELPFPHSLGLLYTAFTYYLGFRVNSGEYKVMGLAPYGEPRYADTILDRLMTLHEDGSFRLNIEYFDYLVGSTMTSRKFHDLFGGPPRMPESELTQRHMDIARSIQLVTEEIMLKMAREAHRLTGEKSLCLAGGVALNCVGNGRILKEGLFQNLWVQPAAGDAGGAVGAAYAAWHHYFDGERTVSGDDHMQGSLLGPSYGDDEIESFLKQNGIPYQKLAEEELLTAVSQALFGGSVVGWFQGAMEFGPRALGNRSILANPCLAETQSVLNLKIKFRESFRPFAPAVLEEKAPEFFDLPVASPYMLLAAPVLEKRRNGSHPHGLSGLERLHEKRSDIPAVTHLDYSARVQTVNPRQNRRFYDLLENFRDVSGYPVLVNTSFNVRGEPIVRSYEEAYQCFCKTEMDLLVLGNLLLRKERPEA